MTPDMAAVRVLSVLVAVVAVSACATPGGTVAVVAVGNVTRNDAHAIGSQVMTIGIPKHSAPSDSSTLSSIASATVRVLPLNDDRKDLDVEGTATAAFGVPMGRLRFGYVLRPARGHAKHDSYDPGLQHFCLRVESATDVVAVGNQLRGVGSEASEARLYPEHAPDYRATFFSDPDGVRLEVTNYRQERRDRHDYWNQPRG